MQNNARIETAVEEMRHSLNVMYVLLIQNMPRKCGCEEVDSYIDSANAQLRAAVQNFHEAEAEIRSSLHF